MKEEVVKKRMEEKKIEPVFGMFGIEPVVILINLGRCMIGVQISNLYIEKTCKVCNILQFNKILLKIILKVGSFFFGNGTTFSDEVRFIAKVFRYFTIDVFLEDFQSRRMPGQRKGHFPQICDNLTNGTFPDQQEEVQKVTMNTTLP